jgi:gluconolactonase
MADRFEGKRLNSPNDLVVKSDGSVWFSDPLYGINTDYEGGKQAQELPPRLYRLDADGTLSVAADDFDGPNGLCFSPDETQLYAVESGTQFAEAPNRLIRVFDVDADGKTLSGGQAFCKIEPGMADGIRCDSDGNVWSSAGDGVHCIDPAGHLLGKILVPAAVSNIAFGGRHLSRLFICTGRALYAIYTNVRGAKLL